MEKYHLHNKDGYKIKYLLLFNIMHYFRLKKAHMEDSRSFHSDFSSMLQRI